MTRAQRIAATYELVVARPGQTTEQITASLGWPAVHVDSALRCLVGRLAIDNTGGTWHRRRPDVRVWRRDDVVSHVR